MKTLGNEGFVFMCPFCQATIVIEKIHTVIESPITVRLKGIGCQCGYIKLDAICVNKMNGSNLIGMDWHEAKIEER
jgi:hypothetical protein